MSCVWAFAAAGLSAGIGEIIDESKELEMDVDVIVKSLRIKGFDCDYDVKDVCNCSRETSVKSICCYYKTYKINIDGEVFDIKKKQQLETLVDTLKILER